MNDNEWQIIDNSTETSYIYESKWIEEEERILDFAENPILKKMPLNHIALTFIYTNVDKEIVGISKTNITLEQKDLDSILNHALFLDKINTAKNLNTISQYVIKTHQQSPNVFIKPNSNLSEPWLQKTYDFEDAILYSVSTDNINTNKVHFNKSVLPINCSNHEKQTTKIVGSLKIFHDLYEIIIIMREIQHEIKSIMKNNTKMSKTKKVRISDDSPKKYIYSSTHNLVQSEIVEKSPIYKKRRTQKKMHYALYN